MTRLQRLPIFVLRMMRLPPRLIYGIGLGTIMGRLVLLLTTRGRKTGKQHVTPLQFERDGDRLLLGSMRGEEADWYRNIVADPHVGIQLGKHQFEAVAEPIKDPEQITDFLELRLSRRPRMIASMLRAEGLAPPWTRENLASYALQIAVVAIPVPSNSIGLDDSLDLN